MQCPHCSDSTLMATTTITVVCELAARGGAVKVGGVSVNQVDIKNSWAIDPDTKEERKVRGPITCAACGGEMVYVVDHPKNPVAISWAEAQDLTYEELLKR